MSTLEPTNLPAAVQFIGAIAPGEQELFYRTLSDTTTGPRPRNHKGSLEGVLPTLIQCNAQTAGVFAVVNGGGQDKSSITSIRAFFLDYDVKDEGPSKVTRCPFPPSISVESSPGKFHYYWLIDGYPPTDIASHYDRQLKAFATHMDSDIKATGRARIMRIPGFAHLKAQPFISRLIECHAERRYLWTDFGQWIDSISPAQAPPPAPIPLTAPTDESYRYTQAALQKAATAISSAQETTRNCSLNAEAIGPLGLVKAGHMAIEEAWQILSEAAELAGLEDDEIQRTLKSAYKAATPRGIPTALDASSAFRSAGEPNLLPEIMEKQIYPIDALGELLGGAAMAIAESVQTPLEIAAHSVLTVAAFVAQDKANVAIDGRVRPLSLFVLTVAESGDRKSACDTIASAPLMQWQQDRVAEHHTKEQEYKNEEAVYEAERKRVLADKRTTAEHKNTQLGEFTPPAPPPNPIVICQEPTLEGLQKSFKLGQPSQALFNDEGAQFFGGHGMNKDNIGKTIAGLSKYWDGSPIIRTRAAQGENATMYGRRLSIHLLLQPVIAQEVLASPLLREQGWLARFLVAECESIAGTRLYTGGDALKRPEVIHYHSVITQLLSDAPETDEGGGLNPPEIQLSPEAKKYWIEAYNSVERTLLAGELFEHIKPIASKAAENALRIAGVFAVVEDSKVINTPQIERAWKLVSYYLNSALRTVQRSAANTSQRDSIEVLQWIAGKAGGSATIEVMQKRLIPKRYRKSVVLIRGITAALVGAGKLRITSSNSRGEPCAWAVA